MHEPLEPMPCRGFSDYWLFRIAAGCYGLLDCTAQSLAGAICESAISHFAAHPHLPTMVYHFYPRVGGGGRLRVRVAVSAWVRVEVDHQMRLPFPQTRSSDPQTRSLVSQTRSSDTQIRSLVSQTCSSYHWSLSPAQSTGLPWRSLDFVAAGAGPVWSSCTHLACWSCLLGQHPHFERI
jgi:hypothetical protein